MEEAKGIHWQGKGDGKRMDESAKGDRWKTEGRGKEVRRKRMHQVGEEGELVRGKRLIDEEKG